LRLVLSGGSSALLDHALDGTFSLRATGVAVAAQTWEELLQNLERSPLLSAFTLSARAFSTKGELNPGVVQASARTDVPALNEVLAQVARDLRVQRLSESLLFREMALELDIHEGRISLERPLLRISGLRLATELARKDAEVRVFLGRPGNGAQPLTVGELAGFLRRFVGPLSSPPLLRPAALAASRSKEN
jgi:hypothetical protein